MKTTPSAFASAPPSGPALHHELTWRDYLGILRDRAWIAVTVFLIVVAASQVHVRRQTPYYRSTARILVEEDVPRVLNIENVISASARNLEQFNSHVMALHSRTMVQKAIEAGGLATNAAFTHGAAPGTDLAELALGHVAIEPVPRSRMIDIVVEHPDPQVAAILANGLAEQYVQQNLDRRIATSMEAFEWLRRQSEEYRQKVEAGRLALHEYRREAQEVSLEERQDIVIGRLKEISTDVTRAESERLRAETEWNTVQLAMTSGAPLTDLPMIANDAAVRQAQADIVSKQSEVATLRQRYLERHPELQRALAELKACEDIRDKVAREAARQVEAGYKLAIDKEKGLRKALEDQEQTAFELERKLVKYDELKRMVEADQHVYDSILARMQETKVTGNLQANNISLVESAKPAAAPCRPLKQKALVNSLVLGLVLGLGLSFVVHFADDRLRRPDEVEHRLGLPLLGVVTIIEGPQMTDRALVTVRSPMSPPSEEFRTIRAAIALKPEGEQMRRLMVTSTTAGEGKSLVASNLSIVLANDGKKTLLIDADLRRPTVHRTFGLKDRKGLAEVLAGGVKAADAVFATSVPNLFVMPCGHLPQNPSELLGSQAMRALFEQACGEFDRIVIDCPPVFGVSDPLALLPSVDGIVFVARFNSTGARAARHAINRLREGRRPLLGAILNDVNIRSSGSYYYYYRRYGYGRHRDQAPRGPDAAARS